MVADLANASLCCNQPPLPHKLDRCEEAVVVSSAWPLQSVLDVVTRDPYLQLGNSKPVAYVDVFVDGFLGLSQGTAHRQRHILCFLFHALDKLFQTLDTNNM